MAEEDGKMGGVVGDGREGRVMSAWRREFMILPD
jgi:hypothetical protein